MSETLLVVTVVVGWVVCTGSVAWIADWLLSERPISVRIIGALGFPVLVNALFLAGLMVYFSGASVSVPPPATSPSKRNDSVPLRPPVPQGPADLLRSQVREIGPGLVVFNPPTEMTVGDQERVTVRIMRGLIDRFSKQPLEGRGTPKTEEVRVGNFMRARLFGDGFEITTHSDESQAVADNDFAEWLYDVLPTKSGDRTLTLQIAIRYKLASSEEVTNLPVLSRDISVLVNPWWTTKTFVSTNWQWFFGGLGGLVVSVGGFFGRRWLDEKRAGGKETGYADP